MKSYCWLLAVALLVLISGCNLQQEQTVKDIIEEHRGEIESGVQESVKKANCQAFSGFVCSASDDCAVPYLNTTESYCCPIPCQTCNIICDDGNDCTKDYCSKGTGYGCKHDTIKPCANNGVCEEEEFPCNHQYCSQQNVASVCGSSNTNSEDCPLTCSDGNSTTEDWYNFETQTCKHQTCI